jgi:hypothetical protein
MTHIIFNGPPGTGKDEACNFLKLHFGYKHLQFKDQLFIETAKYYNVSLEWFLNSYDDRTIKERPEKKLNGLSRRQAMIHVSEDIIKPKLGKDYFGIKTAEKIDNVSLYCFSDGGFIEEIIPLINIIGQKNICIVQLYRTGCNFSSDSRTYIDGILEDDFGFLAGESRLQNQPDVQIRMYRVYNNASVSDFHQIIKKILRKEANVQKNDNIFRKSI